MTSFGILGFGAYLPRRRLQRAAIHAANSWFAPGLAGLAKGERAIANWDEDAITMAVEAARDCLTGVDRTTVHALTLASTTHPFADRLNAGVVKEALALPDTTRAADASGSLRAGTGALIDALNGSQTRLCLASDLRKARPASEGELTQGDGAAAILVGHGEPIAELVAAHTVTIDFVDHFRATGMPFDYAWESRWIRDEGHVGLLGQAIADALQDAQIAPAAIDHSLIAVSARGVAPALAKTAGLRAETVADPLGATIGDTGTAHPLLMLAATLERAVAGQLILLASFGQGADVLILRVTEALHALPRRRGVIGHSADRQADSNYSRFLFHRGLLDLEKGQRAELDEKQPGTSLYRNRKAVLGLIGARNTQTGAVQFPPSPIALDPDSRNTPQEPWSLAERQARVVTFTADSLTYSPDPPTYYGTLDFEGGGRMVTEFAEVGADDVAVGRAMRMVFRIKAVDVRRGFIKYFWKAALAAGEA